MKVSKVPERKGFVIPDFIYDTFNLSLLEAGQGNDDDYYTIEELKVLVADRIKELNRLGYKVSADQILEYEIINTTDITAGIKSVSNKQYKFVIAKLAARKKNEKYLNTIIYHELCHMLQLEFLFNDNLIFYVNGKLNGNRDKSDLVNNLLLNNGRHTYLWQAFAHELNTKLVINPPIEKELSDKDLSDIFLESIFKKEGFEIPDEITDYWPALHKE